MGSPSSCDVGGASVCAAGSLARRNYESSVQPGQPPTFLLSWTRMLQEHIPGCLPCVPIPQQGEGAKGFLEWRVAGTLCCTHLLVPRCKSRVHSTTRVQHHARVATTVRNRRGPRCCLLIDHAACFFITWLTSAKMELGTCRVCGAMRANPTQGAALMPGNKHEEADGHKTGSSVERRRSHNGHCSMYSLLPPRWLWYHRHYPATPCPCLLACVVKAERIGPLTI